MYSEAIASPSMPAQMCCTIPFSAHETRPFFVISFISRVAVVTIVQAAYRAAVPSRDSLYLVPIQLDTAARLALFVHQTSGLSCISAHYQY